MQPIKNKILNILNKNIVINENFKKNIIKILKNNIFIFFILGTMINWIFANKVNFYIPNLKYYLYSTIEFILYFYIPFFLSLILNLIIKYSKNEFVKKIFKVIMIITNILSVLYLLLWAWIICFFELPPQG